MRVSFTAIAAYGHTYPLLPLATAAREAGHEVTFATSAEMLPALEGTGLRTVAASANLHEAFGEAFGARTEPPSEEELPAILGKIFGELVPRRNATELGGLLERERPDLVVYELSDIGAQMAARLARIPAVRHGFGRVAESELTSLIRRHTAVVAEELGLTAAQLEQHTDPLIDICPDSAQSEGTRATANRIRMRPTGWEAPAELPVRSDLPLVYLTLGTVFGSTEVLRAAIDGLASLDAEVLVATGPSVELEEVGEVPENVRLESWVPQVSALQRCVLAVHHGGSAATMGAFAAGVPQLVLPQGADQFTNAEAVSGLGLGETLTEVTATNVAEAARRLLEDESIARATKRMAEEVATMPGPDEIAARLPEFTGVR